jgi:hypothetical protein
VTCVLRIGIACGAQEKKGSTVSSLAVALMVFFWLDFIFRFSLSINLLGSFFGQGGHDCSSYQYKQCFCMLLLRGWRFNCLGDGYWTMVVIICIVVAIFVIFAIFIVLCCCYCRMLAMLPSYSHLGGRSRDFERHRPIEREELDAFLNFPEGQAQNINSEKSHSYLH